MVSSVVSFSMTAMAHTSWYDWSSAYLRSIPDLEEPSPAIEDLALIVSLGETRSE